MEVITKKNEVSHICPLKLDGKPHFHQLNGLKIFYTVYIGLSIEHWGGDLA